MSDARKFLQGAVNADKKRADRLLDLVVAATAGHVGVDVQVNWIRILRLEAPQRLDVVVGDAVLDHQFLDGRAFFEFRQVPIDGGDERPDVVCVRNVFLHVGPRDVALVVLRKIAKTEGCFDRFVERDVCGHSAFEGSRRGRERRTGIVGFFLSPFSEFPLFSFLHFESGSGFLFGDFFSSKLLLADEILLDFCSQLSCLNKRFLKNLHCFLEGLAGFSCPNDNVLLQLFERFDKVSRCKKARLLTENVDRRADPLRGLRCSCVLDQRMESEDD